jgi:hypothetical protein
LFVCYADFFAIRGYPNRSKVNLRMIIRSSTEFLFQEFFQKLQRFRILALTQISDRELPLFD